MLKFKYYTSICGVVPSQKLAIIAIKHRDKIFARNREIIADNLTYSDIFFKKHNDLFKYNRPMAGPIAFHKLISGRPAVEFCGDLVMRKGVLLAYGSLFDMGGDYFRMGYGRRNFKEALDILDEYINESPF
jgi:aspartate/methionine/tyrosine aminotransferase